MGKKLLAFQQRQLKRERQRRAGILSYNNQPKEGMLQLPVLATVAMFSFNPLTIVAIDQSEFEPQKEGRIIVLYLIGEVDHEFINERADSFFSWYISIWGTVQLANQPLIT